ncbi:acetoacetate decarboxylase family protein [Chloroflexota bacterium]
MDRKQKSFLISPLVLAGGIAVGYAGLKSLLGLKPGADKDFFNWTGPAAKGVDVGSVLVDLPVMYYRDDSFLAIFGASFDPARALLPSDDLYPVTLPDGRAMVAVLAFNYHRTSIGPYGEVAIAILCTHGRQAPPLLPLALEGRFPGWGAFILHLPVTSLLARDGGRVIYGFAKFVADMDFEQRPAYQRVRLSEGESHILTLTVQQSGLPIKDNRPLITYSVLDGELLRTTVPSRAVYQVGLTPGSGTLELGDHHIADQLRELDISTTAFVTKNYLSRSGILPAGEVIGPAERPHTGHLGTDREFGRLTVNYDDTGETIDLYARLRS